MNLRSPYFTSFLVIHMRFNCVYVHVNMHVCLFIAMNLGIHKAEVRGDYLGCWSSPPFPHCLRKSLFLVVYHCKETVSWPERLWGLFGLCLPSFQGSAGMADVC